MFAKTVIKYSSMKKRFDYDYIIIGSGPAGTAAALNLAKSSRLRIAIVESGKLGGSYVNGRDLPYDVALGFAHSLNSIARGGKTGLAGADMHFNYPTTTYHRESIIKKISNDLRTNLKAAGITIIEGLANFLDANRIAVGEYQYSAKRFIIATGAKTVSNISGVTMMDYLTPETALGLKRLPRVVCVVGGGPAGCETAQYFAELGVKTILLELTDRLLPREDTEAGTILNDYFTDELGITVLTNARAVAIRRDEISDCVIFSQNGQEKMVRVEAIVIATGSEPNVDLGLENAGVKYKYTGITVDSRFKTTAKNIWAIGDVIGGESSTDLANYQGAYLAQHLTKHVNNLPNYDGFARVTRTFPCIATVGVNEDDMRRLGRKYNESTVFLPIAAASMTKDFGRGFVKILTDKNGLVIGATIAAPGAEDLIQELALAVSARMNITKLANAPHLNNTFSIVIRVAAKQLASKIR